YRVEAFYNNSCVASDSVVITPTFQGVAMPPSMPVVSANRVSENTYDVEVSWGLPYFEEPMAYGYCGSPAYAVTPEGVSTVFALIGWDTASLPLFEDLYLVGMEYVVGTTELTSLDGVVYIDNVIVHTQSMGRYQANKWQTLYFTKAFAMNYKTELAVGYIASFDPDTRKEDVLMIDAGPGKRAFSDILSYDGRTSTTLAAAGIDANLCINALIVRRRDLEEAALAPDPAAYLQEKMIRMEMPWKAASSTVLTDGPKTTSDGIKLLGFNVYNENDVKLNETLLTGLSFQQTGLKGGHEYGFTVGAQYDGAEEQLAATLYIDPSDAAVEVGKAYGLRVYPNPVGENLHIEGEYRTLILTDLAGKRVGKVLENAGTVSMTALQSGVYLLHFTLLDGRNLVVKVVKR
ncbi:MAG: T9SS type A sorting domain-containing protein, partial [Bacteroidales bacterium]|nr:T9SS type A sorting domain-containing protein [Bacteroidales bacterium]